MKKPLFEHVLPPAEGTYWPAIPCIIGGDGYVVEVKNGSDRAVRIVAFDAQEEWEAEAAAEREKNERQLLADLKAKYE